MALGTVVTAKGKRMDFAQLVRHARTPIETAEKHEVARQMPPPKELRARGHMPSSQNVIKPNMTGAVVEKPAPAPLQKAETKSLADYTGVTIDEPKHMKERPEDAAQSANEALVEILGSDMQRAKSRPVPKKP